MVSSRDVCNGLYRKCSTMRYGGDFGLKFTAGFEEILDDFYPGFMDRCLDFLKSKKGLIMDEEDLGRIVGSIFRTDPNICDDFPSPPPEPVLDVVDVFEQGVADRELDAPTGYGLTKMFAVVSEMAKRVTSEPTFTQPKTLQRKDPNGISGLGVVLVLLFGAGATYLMGPSALRASPAGFPVVIDGMSLSEIDGIERM